MTILPNTMLLRDSPHHLRMVIGFLLISFLLILSTALVLSTSLSRYIVGQMMMRDATVSAEFLNSVVHVEKAADYFLNTGAGPADQDIEEFLTHVGRLPDVFRANVYARDGEILWSSDAELIGQRFPDNGELAGAMRGELHPELNVVERGAKEEHVGFPEGITEFIEYYIPIRSSEGGAVVGAVEVYKAPGALLVSIHRVRTYAWLGALAASAVLFGGLAVVITYASRVLVRQEARTVETERLAVVGEMASAVAHGLRNPLASIRSCAELTLDDDIPDSSRQTLTDITDQVDRLEGWIRSFLIRSRRDPGNLSDQAQIDQVIARCIDGFQPQLTRRSISVAVTQGTGSPMVLGRPAELEQVLNTIISNGMEAMEDGGVLGVTWTNRLDGTLEVKVTDTGPGIPPDMMHKVFEPFQTGKAAGLGVGLALGRRIAERMGGSLDLANGALHGAVVTLRLPAMV
ncbi:MAG: ATP-binding protein [Rhodobacteraceae bacterium]|nr:ATP-binding protein [Paracoccaceae bacterium]